VSNPILRVLGNEVAKTVRSKLAWFGLGTVALICCLVSAVAGEVSPSSTANGWGYVSLSMQLAFTDIGLICVIVFAAMLMAEETRSGTIRAALAGPIHRWEFYLAKVSIALLYTLVLSLAALAVSAAFGLRFGYGPVADSMGTVYGRGEVIRNFIIAYFASWIPLATMALYALLVSSLIRSSGAAVAVGIAAVYIVDFTKPLVGVDSWVFTKYIGYPWQVMHQVAQGVDGVQWQPEVWRMVAICVIYGAVAFAAGLTVFVRRDLNG
jgi:ABC-type transport system involved in multi-copper enzyme maturation permease subunit